MKSFELTYKIEAGNSWEKDSIKIKSNLADDELIRCELSKSLVDHLKTESALFDSDKLLLAIAESQRKGIQDNLAAMDDLALAAKVRADKAHEILSTIAEDAEAKYEEIEKSFSATEKRFNEKMKTTAENIKKDLEKLSSIEDALNKINNWSLEKLTEAVKQLIKLAEADSELVKLVLNHKNKSI